MVSMTKRRPWYSVLYIQGLIVIAVVIAPGYATSIIFAVVVLGALHETMAHPLAAGEAMEVVPA
jgi:hypothetical protein